MRILVCVKRVPAPGARINVTVDGQAVSLGREVLGKQFASLDLDTEFLFEVEDDVEEIN